MANSAHDPEDVNHPTDIDDLRVPPNRRHGISVRIANGDASRTEVIHHLLGAYADDTLTGGLNETQILAELLADLLGSERHAGTLARHIANRLEVLTGLAEQAEQERTAS